MTWLISKIVANPTVLLALLRAIAYADVVDRSKKWFTFNGL